MSAAGPDSGEALVLFPHQLFAQNGRLACGKRTYLVEDALYFEQYAFHKQKLVLHRASMRAHAEHLRAAGMPVTYIEAGASMAQAVAGIVAQGSRTIHYIDPVDDWLERRLLRAVAEAGLAVIRHPTPMFLSDPRLLDEHFNGVAHFAMARFYVAQRKSLRVMVEGHKPVGGKWSFDAENRRRLPRNLSLPRVARPEPCEHVAEAQRHVDARYAGNPGSTARFAYPVNHAQASAWLGDFLDHRLALFGDYEDAIAARESILFHAVLTPVLNTGLLTPAQVIDAVLTHAGTHSVPLNSLEGFIRQIIGWREFVRGAYVYKGRAQRAGNFWGHSRPLPPSFWTARTGIEPVDTVIQRVLDTGYAHHIERLMVLANFMLLCEFDPHHVYRWFMELFIDAYDWVMVPNVYGMGLHADGGLMSSKPYISSSNYVLKMSDFKRGPWCEIWDGLFWRFIDRHRKFFSGNLRLNMMVRNLDRMDAAQRARHIKTGDDYLATLPAA
jgi:deoxyribodipyrimidine photolyase-related protein